LQYYERVELQWTLRPNCKRKYFRKISSEIKQNQLTKSNSKYHRFTDARFSIQIPQAPKSAHIQCHMYTFYQFLV
jgi:hypothetical protein